MFTGYSTMNVKKRTILESTMDKFVFQAKTERLDWKIISCIDIDAIVREGDVNKLEELINPVTFCKADAEFADNIPKSHGFIKVFRLSQLISEYLLGYHEKYEDKVATLEEKYNASEKEKEKLSEELVQLKESLASARKELKRRKDMLTSNQNDLLGPNNTDEYDQCPYCSKKFLASGYLVAHMQRRHQGLPINPFYPSLPPGAPACVHYQQQSLTNLGPLTTGGNESVVNSRSSQQTVPSGQQQLPMVNTPTLLSNLLAPNNPSFSGSVTSLNQMFSNQIANTPSNDNLDKIDSFTQTSLLDDGVTQNYNSVTDDHQFFLKQILRTKKFPNFPLNYFQQFTVNPEILVGTLVEKYLEQKSSSSTISLQDGIRKTFPNEVENPPAEQNGSNKDKPVDVLSIPRPHDGYVATSVSSKNREWVEAAELNVIQMQDKFNTQWQNLEEKVRQSGIEELKGAIIPEVTKVREFSTDSSSKIICEEGEIQKAPSGFQNQSSEKVERQETEDFQLQLRLQQAIQDQIQPLISRLESQEQFWKDKLAFVQQDHEQQIQQLRQELVVNRSFAHVTSTDNLITKEPTPTLDVNGVVVEDDKSEMNKKNEDVPQSFHPAGVIVVGPKGPHNNANSKSLRRQHSFSASSPGTGATRDESSEIPIPVAKPRKSKTGSALIQSSEPEENSLSEVPKIHHHQTHHDGLWKTTVQLESLSISEHSDPEYLTIIQPEELPENKHEHSMPSTTIRMTTNKNTSQMEIHSKRKNKSATWAEDINSDELSDYSLSDSVVEGGDDENNTSNAVNVESDSKHHHQQSIDHRRGKLSTKHTPVKKKNIIFDNQTRKLVEVSPDDEDEDDQSACVDLNSSDDNDNGDDRKSRKSQLDLVRAKTKMELEQQMTQIGLNPESRAIGLEEMGRALKHLKYQRRASTDQIHDVGKFEDERNTVKTFAKFEATKTSIDGKLDAISTLTSSKKASKNSFGRMLSAVKTSGKMFGKKVVSAVKKKPKSEKGVDENKSRKKSSPTLPLKTTFFSKSRWRRKKKGDAEEKKKSVELQDDGDHTCTDSESSDEVELSPYMTRSKPIHPNRRASTRSLGKGNAFQRNGSRSRSHSRPKSAKPLKRLNNGNSSIPPSSTAATTPVGTLPSDRVNNNDRKENNSNDTSSDQHSSASPPFSNVDEHESDFSHNDKDEVEYVDNHTHQKQGKRIKENEGQKHEMENAVINELKERFNRKAEADKVQKSRERNPSEQMGKRETISENEDETEEDWDAASDNPRTKHDLHNANKSRSFNENDNGSGSDEGAFMTLPGGNKSAKQKHGWVDVELHGNTRLAQVGGEISDDRLHEIKQVISQSKKQMNSDTTSSSEDDLVDYKSNQQRRRSKGNRKSRESQEKLPDERKMTSYPTSTNNDYNIDSHLSRLGKTGPRQNNQQQESGRVVQKNLTSGSSTSVNPKYGAHPVAPTLASRHKTSAHISFANDGDEFRSDDSSFLDLHSKEKANIVGNVGIRQGQNSRDGIGARFTLPTAAQGQSEITRKLNSSEEIEKDVRDLLNATMSDDNDESKFQGKPNRISSTLSHPSSSAAARDLRTFRSTNSYNLQPTHNMDIMRQGSRNFASGLGTKNKLQSNERNSPSNNSWD